MSLVLMVLKGIPALLLIFGIWPLLLGTGLGLKKNTDRFLVGFAAVQAIFFIVYIPAILMGWSSKALAVAAVIIISALSVGGAFIRYRSSPFTLRPDVSLAFLKNPFFVCALLVILFEMWQYAAKEPYIYGDDTTYIRIVNNIVDTNAIYVKEWAGQEVPMALSEVHFKFVFTSYYPFLGMMSILSGLHPLILCKTVLPLYYLPVHYLIVWRIGSYLFSKYSNKDKVMRQSVFLFFYTLLIEFGLITNYTMSRRILIWVYNGKSDSFCLLLLILFFYMYVLAGDPSDTDMISGGSLYRKLIVVLIAAACNSATMMSLIFSFAVMMIWLLVFSVRQRKISIIFSNIWMFIPHVVTVMLIILFTGIKFWKA